jgi:hypothetical protein
VQTCNIQRTIPQQQHPCCGQLVHSTPQDSTDDHLQHVDDGRPLDSSVISPWKRNCNSRVGHHKRNYIRLSR